MRLGVVQALVAVFAGGACDSGRKAPVPSARPAAERASTADAAVLAPAYRDVPPLPPRTVPDPKQLAANALASLKPTDRARANKLSATFAKMSSCKPRDIGFGPDDCAARDTAKDALEALEGDTAGAVRHAALLAVVGDPALEVRMWTFELAMDQTVEDYVVAAAILDAERDENIVESMIEHARMYRSSLHDWGPVGPAVLARTDDPADRVRRAAYWALAQYQWLPPGTIERLVATIEAHPSKISRGDACEVAGWSKDDRVYDAYRAVLVPATEPDVYDKCFSGLVDMLTQAPPYKKAFDTVVTLLATGRHDVDANEVFDVLRDVNRRPKWLDLTALRKALSAWILDDKALNRSRFGAVEALAHMDADKDLAAIRTTLSARAEKSGTSDDVVDCIDEVIERDDCSHVRERVWQQEKTKRGR